MLITYFRSSSFSTHDACEHKYFLEYVIGMRGKAGQAADMGTIVHKALELLASKKIAEQKGNKTFQDDHFGRVKVSTCEPDKVIEMAYDYYSKTTPHHWIPSNFKKCRGWMYEALNYNNGEYDPRNRKILAAEQVFDFEIDRPWAAYNYAMPDGTRLQGQLRLKGTVDLITEVEPGVIEIIDWKTGARKNWWTDEEKNLTTLKKDPQPLIYHYAASHLFPKAKTIIFTIFYLEQKQFYKENNGGPYSLLFTPQDLPNTEATLQKKFLQIKQTTRPKLNITWRCTRFCFFGKNNYPGTQQTYCEYFKDKVLARGINDVVKEDVDLNNLSEYGDSAGRKRSAT